MNNDELKTVPTRGLIEELEDRIKQQQREIERLSRITGHAHVVVRSIGEEGEEIVLEEGDSLSLEIGAGLEIHFPELEYMEKDDEST